MATIEYVMKPQGRVLEEFADCRSRNSFIMGPLGSGRQSKSFSNSLS